MNGRPAVRGHALPFLAFLVAGVAATLLLGGSGVPRRGGPPRSGASRPETASTAGALFVPAAAHAAGANGASWRTDVEVHNPGTSAASFTVQLLRRDTDNSSPSSRSYTLEAGRSRRFVDVLVSEFGFEGAAALRVWTTSGTLLVTSRTYNLLGANPWSLPMGASFGQFVPGIADSEAIGAGQEGRLIHLTQQAASSLNGFRTNLGLVNAAAIPIDVRVDLYRSDGTWLGKKDGGETSLPPYGFRQLNEVFAAWGTVSDGYAIARTTTPGGALFAFGTVIDNHNSGDPIFVPAMRLTAGSSGPTPTATPTPTRTATPTPTPTPTATPPAGARPDLVPYKPSGWQNPLVPDYQRDSLSTTFLSAHMTTYVRWAVANLGTADIPGTVRFELRIDGIAYKRWYTDTGLRAGYYVKVENAEIPYDTMAPGTHTLTLIADPDTEIVESNESNNAWSGAWEWSSIVFGPPRPAAGVAASAASEAAVATSAEAPIYIPASAHASGLNGASWRSDVEVHNPGTTSATFSIALLKQATDNGGSVPAQTFSLGPQQSVRYVDVLSSVFGTSGAAALRVTPLSGTILVNSRTYNLIGPNDVGLPVGASFGQYVSGVAETEAIGYGEEGRIIQLTHRDSSSLADFRSNIGYVNTTASPIDVRIDLWNASGGFVGSIQDERTHLRAYEFLQINGIFGAFTSWQDDGYAVIRTTTPGGRFFAFATVIDNHLTGDPIFIPAQRVVPDGGTVVGSGTVGSSGGTVSGGGLGVTVPAGAWTQSATLTIRKAPGASTALDRYRTSEVFQLEGLPDDRAKAVTLTVDVTRSVSVSGADVVAVAGEVFVPTAAESLSPPLLLDASRSGSKTTATIPPTSTGGVRPTTPAADADAPQSYSIWSATGFTSLDSAQGHFHVKYPIGDVVLGFAEEIASGLESAYPKISALGFDWSRRGTSRIQVCIEPFPAETATRLAEEVPSKWGLGSHWLHVNASRLTSSGDVPLMKDSAAHELFHLAQFLYDPRNRITMATSPGVWLWADEATSVWFENHFNGSSSPPQVVRENHAFMTRRGLEFPPGDAGTVQDHGYGAALLMRDLAARKGNGAVGELVRMKSNSQVLPVDAYDTVTGQSAGSTWKLFLEEYAAAHLYAGFPTPADLWVASSGNRYAFATASDTGTTFSWTAPDLSARFYGIQFTDKTWAAGTTLTLALTDAEQGAASIVYTLRSGQLTKLGIHHDGDVFKVENADAFANNGTSLFVIVVNGRAVRPYSGATPISLRVSTGVHNELKFRVPGVQCSSGLTLAMSFWNTFQPSDLTWTGNTVKASFSGSLWGYDQTEYTGTATLSSDRRTLVSFDFTYHSVALFNFSYCTPAGCRWEDWQSITWTGVGPASDWQPNGYHFSAAGVVARNLITAFSMREVRTGDTSPSGNFDCRFPIDETKVNEITFDSWLTPP